MVAVTCDIDTAAVARLDGLLTRIEREMPERLAGATKRAGLYVIGSLKKRTIKAPKRMRKSEYSLEPMRGKYITRDPRRGTTGPWERATLHRWEFKHIPSSTTKHFAAYATRQRSKATKWKWRGLKLADERREIITSHDLLKIRRAGLAKVSWDWVFGQIMRGHASMPWRRMRGERRDPRNFVKGLFTRLVGKGAAVEIKNALDYIMDALKPGALAEAMDAASKRLEHNISEEIGKMTA